MQLTEQNVQNVIVEDSMHKAVFVYFYQDGPECQATTTALESQIGDNNEYVSLVKANIADQISQAIAMQIGLRGVPALIIFKDGKPCDAMQGDQIANDLPNLLQKYMPSESELTMRKALEAEASGNLQEALTFASKAYDEDKSISNKHILARMFIKAKNLERAKELLDNPGREESESKDYQDLISALDLALAAQSSPALLELEAKYKENPNDIQTLTDLAIAYKEAGKVKEALEILYLYLKSDLSNNDVKKVFLDILNTISGDPLQNTYRRKLYTLMY